MGSPQDPRPRRVQTRLSPTEETMLLEAAKRSNLTLSAYLRECALQPRAVSRTSVLDRDAQREIWKQVAGVARNTNQIAKKANMNSIAIHEVQQLAAQLERLIDFIGEVAGKKKQ